MLNYDDDALPHAKTSGRNWRESYYCNFMDPKSNLCGVFWQGVRPNAGHGEAVFLLADGKKDLIRSAEMKEVITADIPERRRKVGDQEFTCVEPWKRWKVRYEKGENWFEVNWQPLSDVCDWDWEELSNSKHFQVAGKVSARGRVNGRAIEFEGYGERDRAWGDRDYNQLRVSLWHVVQFPDDVAVHVFALRLPSGSYNLYGYIHKDGKTRGIAKFDIDVVYEGPKGPPKSGRARYEDDLGRVIEVSSYQLVNHLSFGASHSDGAQLGGNLDKAELLMFLSFHDFKRADGVRGRGMIDYNCWVGEQVASINATADPLHSTLYNYGRT